MKELSVFVDESGDFGAYDPHAPFYIISMVFHDQDIVITDDVTIFETELSNIGLPHHCIHSGPIIRAEEEYHELPLQARKKILMKMMCFIRHIDIQYKTFHVDKKHTADSVEMAGLLSKSISKFIKENYDYFTGFDVVKIYYDNGQVEVSRILSSVFHALLDNVEFRKVIPSEYRLFQVADFVCTLHLTDLKEQSHQLSRSEKLFFSDHKTLFKNYLKPLTKKEL